MHLACYVASTSPEERTAMGNLPTRGPLCHDNGNIVHTGAPYKVKCAARCSETPDWLRSHRRCFIAACAYTAISRDDYAYHGVRSIQLRRPDGLRSARCWRCHAIGTACLHTLTPCIRILPPVYVNAERREHN